MALTIGFFEIILAVICFVILRGFSNKDGVPRHFPVVGMLPDLLLQVYRVHDWSTEILERNQCTFAFNGPRFANMDILVTCHPANIHYIMSTNFANFPKGSEFKKMFDILGDGIFNSDLDLWKTQRKFAREFINHQRFHKFLVQTIQDKVENGIIPVLEHVSKHGLEFDFQDLFQRFTFDATCKLVTGYDPKSLSVEFPAVPFSKAMDDAEEAIFYRHIIPERIWRLQKWLGIGQEKKLSNAGKIIDQVIGGYISMKREELGRGNIVKEDGEGIDVLTLYMGTDQDDSVGSKPDDKFLRDTIMNFMIAGRDTTASALAWFFWLLSEKPQVESKIREELESKIPANGNKNWWVFDLEELNKLVYLHGAICETLRLYPPVPFQHKAPLRPDTLPSGHHVHPKMKILFSLYAMGRMTSIWGEDCFEFKPERWISERGGIKHEPSYKFLAFNAGPRTCVGKDVAFTQMKAVAAAIIHNYNVQVVKGHPVSPCGSVILHMKNGLMVKVSKRSWA